LNKKRHKKWISKPYVKTIANRPPKAFHWKSIVLYSISILVFVIIFIPALIVMIPQKKSVDTDVSSAKEVTGKDHSEDVKFPELEVSVKRSETGDIEKVDLEQYVLSVVASEMPAEFEIEALKAQAVAARTYVVNHLLHQNEEENALISDSTEHQVYKNDDELKTIWGKDYHWKLEKIQKAVSETKNEIVTYNQAPITPTFFSMSNGYTENAEDYWGNELPYLKSVESKWEENLPNFIEQKVLSKSEVSEKLNTSLSIGEEIPISIERTKSNRVSKLNVNGETFSGREIREKLGLRSNDFTIQQKNEHLIFTTKGYGHGVGMSQYGADGMAKEGKDYKEILFHYYQNVELETISEVAPTLVAK